MLLLAERRVLEKMEYSFRKSVSSFYYFIVRMTCHVSAFSFYLSHLEVSMETCKENGYSYMYKKAVSKGTLSVKGRRIERILRAPILKYTIIDADGT